MCTNTKNKYSLGNVVYTTKDNIATKQNAMSACGKHSMDNGKLYYTLDGTIEGCKGPVEKSLFYGECISYFHPDS
jgi:hypothetical protein